MNNDTMLTLLPETMLAESQKRAAGIVGTINSIADQVRAWLAPLDGVLPPTDLLGQADGYLQRGYVTWTTEDYERIAELAILFGRMETRIKAYFDPIRAPANNVHKMVTGPQATYTTPLSERRDALRRDMGNWQVEHQRKAEAEAAAGRKRLYEEAEAKRLAEAEAAVEIFGEAAADEVLAAPIVTKPVVMPVAVPKVEGVSKVRMRRTYHVVNFNMLVAHALDCLRGDAFAVQRGRQLVLANDAGLQQIAEQLGSMMDIPGVKYREEPIINVRRS